MDSSQKGQLAALTGRIAKLLSENQAQQTVIASQREQIDGLNIKLQVKIRAFDNLYDHMMSKAKR